MTVKEKLLTGAVLGRVPVDDGDVPDEDVVNTDEPVPPKDELPDEEEEPADEEVLFPVGVVLPVELLDDTAVLVVVLDPPEEVEPVVVTGVPELDDELELELEAAVGVGAAGMGRAVGVVGNT